MNQDLELDTSFELVTSDTAAPEFELSDAGNGERLMFRHENKLRFVAFWNRPIVYHGGYWRSDDTLAAERLAIETIRSIKQAGARLAESDDPIENRRGMKLLKHALACESRNRIKDMISMAATVKGATVLPAELDRDPWKLNVQNGTIDLRTGTLARHCREDFITKCCPVEYDPAAACPTFDRFLKRVMGENPTLIQYLGRLFGMALTGDVSSQELFIFHGSGANGKSVLVDTIAGLMGEYAAQSPPSLLVDKRNEEHPTEIADLMGRRLVFASETEEGAKLKIQLVKRLTGDGTLKARRMRQDYVEFPRTFKLILVSNNKPRITENTNAVWRRLRLIPFAVVIPPAEQDPLLMDTLKKERPGILAWAVRGCLDWQRNGMLTPAEVVDASADYQAEEDLLAEYIAARCIVGAGNLKATRAELFGDYMSWAHQTGERHPLDRNSFLERIRRISGVRDKQFRMAGQPAPVRGYSGISLKFGSENESE